ncbi:MAG: hypothetical protein PWP48_983 [Clostridiales bacterium]|jgi:cell division protein FtsL|nr:hypothetical protein [Clostridiales bacterium]MDK2991750.1 hypothetical protein [Clostridiales bacterium]
MVVAQREFYEEQMPKRQLEPRPKVKKRNRIKPILVVMLMFITFSALVSRHVQIINANYELLDMKKELAQVQKVNDDLTLQLTMANNIDNIEKIARTKLHMHYPEPSQTVYVHISPKDDKPTEEQAVADSRQHKSLWAIIYGLLD